MNQITLTIFFYAAILIVALLASCVIYLVYVYRKLLEKYSLLESKKEITELKNKMRIDTDKVVEKVIENAIDKATTEGISLISKSAEKVAKDIRQKTVEKLTEEEKGEEKAVASEYDDAREEIENFKKLEFERIRKNANEILEKATPVALRDSITKSKQEELIIKGLGNAKQSGFF